MAIKFRQAHNFLKQWEQANRAHEAYLRRLHEKLTARKIPYTMVHDEIIVSHDTCGTINVPAEFAAAVKEAMEEAAQSLRRGYRNHVAHGPVSVHAGNTSD